LPELQPSPLQTYDPADGNYSALKPAVCTYNPGLSVSASGTIFSSVCRAYFYSSPDRSRYVRCTAWFVTSTHAALAGHCVADGGSGRFYPYKVNGRYGTVCCLTFPDTGPDNCRSGYGFDIIQMATTSGWLYNGAFSNDGAVLKLRRPSNAPNNVGVPLSFEQPNPFCPSGSVSFGGYPGQSTTFQGCNRAWNERFVSSTTSGPLQCTTSLGSPSLAFRGSACGGMSGGPMWSTATNYVWGIISQSDIQCPSGRSSTYFAAITNGPTRWGVYLSGLISTVP
jgi:Trypsin